MAIEKEINIVVKEVGLDEVNKKVNKLENSVDALENQQKSLAKSMGSSTQSVLDNGGAMGLLNDATGGLAMTVKDAVEASWLFTKSQKAASIQQAISTTVIGTSTGALKLFRIALAATGVGAIVAGLVLLVSNFDKVKDAALKLIPSLKIVGDFISNIVENITDFIGVTSDATRELARLTEQAEKSNKLNEKFLSEEGDRLNEYTKAKIEAKKRYNQEVVREDADQVKLALRLNRELLAIDKKHDEDLAKARKEKQDKIDNENKAKSEKEKAERLKFLEDERKRLEEERKLREDNTNLENEFNANVILGKLEAENEYKLEKDRILQSNLDNISREVEAISQADSEVALRKKELLDQQISDEELLRDAKINIAQNTLGLLSEIAGKGGKVAKAIALTQATLSGIEGVQNAYTTAQKSPITALFPAYPVVQAALAGAFSAVQIAKISSTNASSGGSSGGGSVGSAPQAPSFNLVQGTQRNQIAESLQKQAPIKAYVVAADQRNADSLDRNIVQSSTL